MKLDYPELRPGQIALIHAELRTGILTYADGKRVLEAGNPWMIFDSLNEARDYAQKRIAEQPEMECSLFDAANQQIERLWNEEHWRQLRSR